MSRYLGLIVKATRLCNLRCDYCHDWRTGRDQTMSFAVMSRMIQAALQDRAYGSVELIWHGGETTVLPIAFYEKALYVESCFQGPGQAVTNSLQTNGTLLTPEWVRFLQRNDFSVSLSLDGPPEIHDRYRRWGSGRGSFADVQRGMRLLREHEVPFSVLMVIDEGALALGPDRIFDFFRDQGINSFALLAAAPSNQPDAAPGTPTRHYVEPPRMTAFLARIFDRWLEHGDPNLRIREIESLRRRISGGQGGACTLAGGCLGRYYAVEPNGDIAHCDVYIGDPRYVLGNVLQQDFQDLEGHAGLGELRAENERALQRMRSCPEFGVCNGWCPHERYLSERHNLSHRGTCCGLRDLIAHMRDRLPPPAGHPRVEASTPAV
jgi:uncharacterized protein